MIARSRAVVGPGGRLAELACEPPLTLRQVISAHSGVCALCLVGSAAGPLAGDDLTLTLEVQPGATATLQATGAAIAQGRPGGGRSVLRFQASVGARGRLSADPGPLIVRPGGRVDARVGIRLDPGATVDWRELIVLSEDPRPPGRGPESGVTVRWEVTRAGRPLLRQVIDLTDPAWLRWPGMIAGRRVLASALLAGPGLLARTIVASPTAVAQQLADEAVLVTVLADDAAAAQRQRDELCACVRAGPRPAARPGTTDPAVAGISRRERGRGPAPR
jgi:urease accessory protein